MDADKIFKRNSTPGATMNRFFATKQRWASTGLVLLVVILLASSLPSACADITQAGDVSVSIYNSTYIFGVGNNSGGTLSITNGSSDNNSYQCYIGCNPGATGVVTVDGAGSNWSNLSGDSRGGAGAGLIVGYYGSGTLSITNGGSVKSTYGNTIGYGSNSAGAVTVNGAGSIWTTGCDLNVGLDGSGMLFITNGGSVSAAGATYVASGTVPRGRSSSARMAER